MAVPKEVKDQERRVSVQPDGVIELTYHGHEVIVEAGAVSRTHDSADRSRRDDHRTPGSRHGVTGGTRLEGPPCRRHAESIKHRGLSPLTPPQ